MDANKKSNKGPKINGIVVGVAIDQDNPICPRPALVIQVGNPDLEAVMSGQSARFFPSPSGNPLDR